MGNRRTKVRSFEAIVWYIDSDIERASGLGSFGVCNLSVEADRNMGYNIMDKTGDFGSAGFNIGAIRALRMLLEKLNKPALYPALTEFIENGISYKPRTLAREAAALRGKQSDEAMRGVLDDLIHDAKRAKRFIALTM